MTRTCVMAGCVRIPSPTYFVCRRHLHELLTGAFGRHEGGALPVRHRSVGLETSERNPQEHAALAAAAGASVAREG